MSIEVNMTAITKSSDLWLNFRATTHVCNNKSLFSAFKEEDDDDVVLIRNYDILSRFMEEELWNFSLILKRKLF